MNEAQQTEKYQLWLDWFITDNKLDIEEILYEGEVEGEEVSVTLEQLLQKSLEMPGWQQDIRRFGLKAQYTGKDILTKLKEMAEEKAKKGFFS